VATTTLTDKTASTTTVWVLEEKLPSGLTLMDTEFASRDEAVAEAAKRLLLNPKAFLAGGLVLVIDEVTR
jgi:hypothetical protein